MRRRSGTALVAISAAAAMAGCTSEANSSQQPATLANETESNVTVSKASDDENCPVLDSRNWHAWIDRFPDGDNVRNRLIVTGQVDLPKPGFNIAWTMGPADRMMPPGQQILLALTEPSGIVAQVVTSKDVRFEGPATYDRYRFIKIRCGDTIIAEMSDVMLTD